ncbi:hypothetical protein [Asticcacaulis solisilvae]|uniref:hypothetical protein n=1 Tax=Asticcacaulis solisilvae TaxID=1217274 RepID=UPI003FD75A38
MAKDKSQSMFALLSGNMQAYVISWVTTFFASLINSIWTTWVFHFDFVSSIDGALASQIGVVLLNELYLLYAIFRGGRKLFSPSGPIFLVLIALNAAVICLLIYAPVMAFKAFGYAIHAEISGHSPIYDEISGLSDKVVAFFMNRPAWALPQIHSQYGSLLVTWQGIVGVVIALIYLTSFFRRKRA